MNKNNLDELSESELEKQLSRESNPKQKVLILEKLFSKASYKDISQTLMYAEKCLAVAQEHKLKNGIALGNLLLASYHVLRAQNHRIGIEYAEKAIKQYTKLKDYEKLGECYRILASGNMGLGNMNEAKEYFDKCINLFSRYSTEQALIRGLHGLAIYHGRKSDFGELKNISQRVYDTASVIGDLPAKAAALSNLATAALQFGQYDECIRLHEENLVIKRKLNDLPGQSFSLMAIGTVHQDYGNYELALTKYRQVQTILTEKFSHLKNQLFGIHSNLCSCYHAIGRFSEALKEIELALSIAIEMGDMYYQASALSTIGKIKVVDMNDLNGMDDIGQALEISKQIDSLEQTASCLLMLSDIFIHRQDYTESIKHGLEGLAISKQINMKALESKFCLELAQSHLALKQYNDSIQYANKALEFAVQTNDILLKSEAYQLLAQSYAGEQNFAKGYEYHVKYHQTKYEILNLNTSHRIQGLFVQFDVERAQQEAEINRIKYEKTQNELDMKQKELVALALHLVNKNEFLQDIKDQISVDISTTNSIVKEVANRIDSSIKQENDWDIFEKQFNMINPTFAAKLQEQSGSALSTTEIKICSLIRTGLSTKEIASILFLSPRTVENHRYNIQRKLNLGDIKLASFIVGL